MANYFTEFCFRLDLPSLAQAQGALALLGRLKDVASRFAVHDPSEVDFEKVLQQARESAAGEDDLAALADLSLFGHWPGGVVAALDGNDGGLAFKFNESGDIEATVAFIDILFDRFGLEAPVAFEWSCTSDRPILDAYGGGAVVVTREQTFWHDTRTWIDETLRQVAAPLSSPSVPEEKACPVPAGVRSFLDLSVGHLPQSDRDLLEGFQERGPNRPDPLGPVRMIGHGYGWFVHVPHDYVEEAYARARQVGFSEAFVNLLKHGALHNCCWINFDSDGDQVEGLAWFEDAEQEGEPS